MPCSFIESLNSRNASAENSFRGWNGHGWMRSKAIRCTRSLVSAAGAEDGAETGAEFVAKGGVGGLAIGLPPKSAPKPLPRAGFAMRSECRTGERLSISVTTRSGFMCLVMERDNRQFLFAGRGAEADSVPRLMREQRASKR